MSDLVSYRLVEAIGEDNPQRDLLIMKILTTVLGPLVRVRGIGLVAKWFDSGKGWTKVQLNDDSVFVFPIYDPYWSYYLFSKKSFEKQLEAFFNQIKNLDFAFLDCGANFGYWSALLSSKPWGEHLCVAVEASDETYSGLKLTSELNGSRIECLQHAVYSSSGEKLAFTEGARHAGRHIVNGEIERLDVNKVQLFTPDEKITGVETITIDDIVSGHTSDVSSILIKLDVEGAEIDALKGAEKCAGMDTVFVYEDFGSDQFVTRYMLDNGFHIYRPQSDGKLISVDSIETAKTLNAKYPKNDHNYIAWRGQGSLISSVQKLAQIC